PAIRREPVEVHVHAVAELWCGDRGTLLGDLRKLVVGGELQIDDLTHSAHAAVRLERTRRKARPQHASGRRWIARRDAELKGIVREARAAADAPYGRNCRAERYSAGEIEQEVASVQSSLIAPIHAVVGWPE